MLYAMRITRETASFIGQFFNNGVMPPVGDEHSYFVFGDPDKSNEVLSLHDFVLRHDFRILHHCAIFTMDD